MPLYTFYHCKTDGSAASFEIQQLSDESAASERARFILADHLSCTFVTVWDGERKVGEEHRGAPTTRMSGATL